MSQQTLSACTAGLTSADLSAWRDDTLPADEAARIDTHRAGCPACQQRLWGFETIAASLHTQQAPIPDERLWQSVLTAIVARERQAGDSAITHETTVPDQSGEVISQPQSPQPPLPPHSWRARALGTLATVAAIALVVVGFGRLFQFGAGIRQQSSFSVKWRQTPLPGGMDAHLSAGASLSVFPADGSIAWICQSGTQATPSPLRIWHTSDGGASWQSIKAPQLTRSFNCQIDLDQLDPKVVVLDLKAYVHPNPNQAVSVLYTTFDGGASWQDNSHVLPMTEFATLNGATYALRQDGTDSYSLEVSRNGAETWNILDNPIHNQKLQSIQFWLNPATGGLLVQARSLVDDTAISLWTVDANGSNWRQLSTPAVGNIVASPASDGQHWNICSLVAGTGSDPQHLNYQSHVFCGTENTSWNERPGLDFPRWGNTTPTPCNGCISVPNDDPYGVIQLLGIANDGALLATIEDRFDAKGQATRVGLYRLPAGSSQWQRGGPLPMDGAIYAPRPAGGMLWSMPAYSDFPRASGPFYTADYSGPAAPSLPAQVQQTRIPAGNVNDGAPLAWQPITQPNGFQPRLTATNTLAVAPSDGRTAYACSQPNLEPPATQPLAWATHDGGSSWTSLMLPQVAGWCALVVDQANPRDLLLDISTNPPMGSPALSDASYRSEDGGVSWKRVHGLDGSFILQFATHGGVTYALRVAQTLATKATTELQASSDGMTTWRAIEGDIQTAKSSVGAFWLNPYNGELLATNATPAVNGLATANGPSAVVWRSSDGGAHWRDLRAPQFGITAVFVQPPQPNHSWGVCAADFEAHPGSSASNTLFCGDDSGQTWHDMTALDTGDSAALPTYTTFTSDGALLALSPAATGSGAATYNAFRLPPGASHWQNLGPTPEFSLLYAPASGADGILWSVPVNGVITDLQGSAFRVAAP